MSSPAGMFSVRRKRRSCSDLGRDKYSARNSLSVLGRYTKVRVTRSAWGSQGCVLFVFPLFVFASRIIGRIRHALSIGADNNLLVYDEVYFESLIAFFLLAVYSRKDFLRNLV